MTFTDADLNRYHADGFVLLTNCFSAHELDIISREWEVLRTRDLPGRVLERDGVTTRSLYAPHTTSDVMRRLAAHPRVVRPVQQMLGGDAYIHQFKINVKAAFAGDMWPWHQDYIYWQREDGMREPRALTAALFLDEVNEFNGPMLFVPGSHRQGVIETAPQDANGSWQTHVSTNLQYTLSTADMQQLVARGGLVSAKGPPGSVVFFHCNVVHGSAVNMSPFDRKMLFVTFNSVANTLVSTKPHRPAFLASRDYRAIVPLEDDALLTVNEVVDSVREA